MLVILDVYGYHKKLVESGRLNAYNVFLVIVHDCLTEVV